jgi:CheY-like chemotaxis protein
VDDNTDAANSLGRLLSLMGHEACVVHNGPAALKKVEDFRPSVVLMDLGMPVMDGLETASLMRRQPWGRGVALIAVTGWGQDRDRERTQAAGFAAHLTKPVNIDQLEAAIHQVLAARRAAL